MFPVSENRAKAYNIFSSQPLSVSEQRFYNNNVYKAYRKIQ